MHPILPFFALRWEFMNLNGLGRGQAALSSPRRPASEGCLSARRQCRLSKEAAKATRQYMPKLELFAKPCLPAVREALREAQALADEKGAQSPTPGQRQQAVRGAARQLQPGRERLWSVFRGIGAAAALLAARREQQLRSAQVKPSRRLRGELVVQAGMQGSSTLWHQGNQTLCLQNANEQEAKRQRQE